MTTPHGFAVFDTAIGRCAVAWGTRGIVGVQLPEARETETRKRVRQRFPGATEASPPPGIGQAIAGIEALLRGEAIDLSTIVLDMEHVPPFHRRVYEASRAISPGTTASYGDVAARIGSPGSARAVGQALGRNPFAVIVPCHRVMAAGGKIGGFSATGGITTKLRMLSIESRHAAGASAAFEGDGAFGFEPGAAVEHLRTRDPALRRVIDRVGPFGMRLQRSPSLFRALAEAIVYQQLTGKAAATIFARVRALFPWSHDGPTPEQILRTTPEKLRTAGLSRSKVLSLRDLAEKAKTGQIPTLAEVQLMADDEIVERLTEVRGIGRWTVEMMLMLRLGRPDVLPVDDYGVRKGLAVVLGKGELPDRKDLEKRGERWRPYRSVASWYLWRACELGKP